MPISRRLAAAVLASCALAGCDPASLVGGAPSRTTVQAGGETITVAAPPGFCVDRRSTDVSSAGAFVLVSDCALLGSATRAQPVGAAMTASISATGLGESDGPARSLDSLESFAATPEGRAVLGRSGEAANISILDSQTSDGVLYVLVDDRGPQPIAGVEPRFWRAFMEVDGRMAALSVLGFEGSDLASQEGLNLIAAFAGAIRAANG